MGLIGSTTVYWSSPITNGLVNCWPILGHVVVYLKPMMHLLHIKWWWWTCKPFLSQDYDTKAHCLFNCMCLAVWMKLIVDFKLSMPNSSEMIQYMQTASVTYRGHLWQYNHLKLTCPCIGHYWLEFISLLGRY